MPNLEIDNYIIDEDPMVILGKLQSELTNGKLSFFHNKVDYIQVQCPEHKGGHESKGSCFINLNTDKAPYLWAHCFTCGLSCNFIEFVAKCFDRPYGYAKNWLINNFGHQFSTSNLVLESINLTKLSDKKYLDDSILEEFSNYHPYFEKRHLTDETVEKFELKYDPLTKMVVFPVRDINGKIAFLTRRSTEGKKFYIDKGADKSVIYLLYNIIRDNIKEVVVCEGQFNRLTSWQYGHPRIALLGAGTTEDQIKVLNKTGIRHYILCYDNDPAGRKGASRFKKFIKKDVFVDDVIMPEGKDINDLTKEEFERLLNE